MRYTASEKLEITRPLERSHLSVRRTLEQIGIPRATFYRWYDLYQTSGHREYHGVMLSTDTVFVGNLD